MTVFKRIESSVSAHAYRFEYAGQLFFYKRFLHRSWQDPVKALFRGTRALRAMQAHQQLDRYGFRAPRVLAVGRSAPRCFLVTEYLQGYIGLNHWFDARIDKRGDGRCRKEKRRMIATVAQLVRQLHDRHLFHGDLGWGHILVKPSSSDGWRFALIDNERTRFSRLQRAAKRIRNLVDLNMTAGTKMSPFDCLRFFKIYMDTPPALGYSQKDWLKTIEFKTAKGLRRKALKKERRQAVGRQGPGNK
jgi:tRNA A-37 threonylcarbamoyl transferase component Bud32